MNHRKWLFPAAAFVITAALLTTGCAGMLQKLPGYLSDENATNSSEASDEPTQINVTTTTDAAADTTTTTATTTTTTATTTTTTTSSKKTTTTTQTQAPESLNGQDVVDYAKQFLGTPYVYGGNDLNKGVDCSGFTKLVYGHFGIKLPRTASQQHKMGTIISYDELLPGDLCTTVYTFESKYTGHAAIYVGDGMVINALPEQGVVYTPLEDLYGEYIFHRIFNNTCN
jgi:Cell wall-associated hydrolases (invasion-associated proteins)